MKLRFILFIVLAFAGWSSAYAQRYLWGMTPSGGSDDKGVIFKIQDDGTGYSLQHSFTMDIPGAQPQGSLCYAGGKLYGLASTGGVNDQGVLFEYDPVTEVYNKKVDFSLSNGSYPTGSLVLASDGKLYGMTSSGGAFDRGVLFSFDPTTGIYDNLYEFSPLGGAYPFGSLIQASNGMLYGMTYFGGSNGDGVIFEFDPVASTYAKKFDFTSATTGANPNGDLYQANDNLLYGLARTGGANGAGVVFRFDPTSSTFTKLSDLSATVGSNPSGSFVQAANNNLYALTFSGGASNQGTIIEYNISSSTLTKKIDFTSNGINPYNSLLVASTGLLYGMTLGGGANAEGTLFEYNSTSNTLTTKVNFLSNSNDSNPVGNVIQTPDGLLYGMTPGGGALGAGIIFNFDPVSNSFLKKLDFSNSFNGASPQSGLAVTSDGSLYGLTRTGGSNGSGTLFKFDPSTSSFVKQHDFNTSTTGALPSGDLVEASDGKLYGLAEKGGTTNQGVLFQFDVTSGTVVNKFSFSGSASGSNPKGALTQAVNGKLYGMTRTGGANGLGVVFEYDPTNGTLTKKVDFNSINGALPEGGLLLAANNKLYGMTKNGGLNDRGVLFEFDPTTGVLVKKLDFLNINGANPSGTLVQSNNGFLYGLTSGGGNNSAGVLFEYDPVLNTATVKTHFSSSTGNGPNGSLIEGSGGKLFGMTASGGANGKGTLFQFDLTSSTLIILVDFNGTNGSSPSLGSPLLVPRKLSQSISFSALPPKNAGDPPFTLSATASSGLSISFISSNPSIASVSGNTVIIHSLGTVQITARQLGDDSYWYAQDIVQPLVINGGNQTITFNPLPTKTFGDAPFLLTASASSGLDVSYASSDPSIASITSSTVTILKAGTVAITALQAGNANFNPAPDVQQTLIINKADQTIAFGFLNPPTRTFGDNPFSLTAAASSGLGVTYISSNPSVATISGNQLTITGAGTATITAQQSGNNDYNGAPDVPRSITVDKANQTITFNPLPTKTFGDPPFALGAATTSGLSIAYSSSDPTIASISGNMVTILRAGGPVIITAAQPGNTNFNPALSVTQNLTINKANQTITFNPIPSKAFGDPPFTLSATTTSGLSITYSSSDPTIASVSGNTVTIIKPGGPVSITASQIGDQNFNPATPVNQNLTVNKANQIITFSPLPAKSPTDPPFALSASASSELAVTFSSSNPTVATVSGNTVTLLTEGTTTITANQAGDANYNAAPAVNQLLVVDSRQSQTITFNSLIPRTFGDPPFLLTATASSGLTVTYSSSNTSVATISGSTVTIVGGGTTTITASQAGSAAFFPATPVDQNLVVNKANQTITFGSLASVPANNPPITLTATTTSGLPLSYSSSNTSIATIGGNLLTLAGAIGTTTITASQAGNPNYNSATPVLQDLVVQKRSQTISFVSVPFPVLGDAPFTLSATSTSGLPVSFQVGTNSASKISIAGSIVTFLAAGVATIRAVQGGDASFNAAPSIDHIFCVNPARPSVTLSSPSPNTFVLTSNSSSGNQWFRNGTSIANASGATYTPPQSGSYQVNVTVESCTSDFSTAQAIVITGDLSLIKNGLIIYPNPVKSKLSVDLSSLSNAPVQLKILDATGRLIHEESAVGGKSLEVPMDAQAPGLYLLFVGQGERSSYTRFVKE